MGLAFGEHNDLREIPNEMLFGQRVETTGEQAYLDEIKRLVVVRSAAVVVGVFSDFVYPPHRLLARLWIVRDLFPKHECIGKLRHHGVLNRFCESAASQCQINPGHGLSSLSYL